MLSYPLRCGVDLVDCHGVLCFGRGCIVGEYGYGAAAYYQVAHQSSMRGVVAQHPAAAVYKDEYGCAGFSAFGFGYVDLYGLSVLCNGSFRLFYA